MKFACEQCKTKYSIADERVRGKVLKIRCKHCSHIITVREESAPRAAEKGVLERAMDQALKIPPAAALQGSDATLVGTPELFLGQRPAPQDIEEWHLSVDGVPSGPFHMDSLARRIIVERTAGDQELFVWRDGFDDWVPPRDVPEVRASVERLRPGLPASFWGTPETARSQPQAAAPPDEALDFMDEPPTLAVGRKAPREVTAPLFKNGTGSTPAPSSQATSPEANNAISAALASLEEAELPGAGADERGAPDVQFNIGEPSQLIDLRALAGAVRPAEPPTSESQVVLPGVPDLQAMEVPHDLPPVPPVLVVSGPAPAAPNRYLKLGLSLAVALCVVLMGTVVYLIISRGGSGPSGDKRANGKAVTDRPINVQDDPQRVKEAGGDAAAKKNGKRPVKLPAAAAGKGQHMSGNAATLAKLYQEGGEKSPPVPGTQPGTGLSGGGISTAELREVINRNKKSLQICYDRHLKHDESLRQARIDVNVKVGLSGMVTHVAIPGPVGNSELGTCMKETIRRWHFPASDEEYEVPFPLLLTAS
jgi:predicted Zn finger-like uncharacterized protein